MEPVVCNVAWAAGLIEGEGCLCVVRNSKAKNGKTAKLVVQMNDLDVLQRLQEVFKVGSIYYRPARKTSKESWAWTVYKAADVKYIITAIYDYLGARRKQKATELLEWINGESGI